MHVRIQFYDEFMLEQRRYWEDICICGGKYFGYPNTLDLQEKDLSRITEVFGVMAEQETESRLSAPNEEYNQRQFSLHCLFLEEHN